MQTISITQQTSGFYTWVLHDGATALEEGEPENSIQACLQAAGKTLLGDPLVAICYNSIPFGAVVAMRVENEPQAVADWLVEGYRELRDWLR